MMNDPSRHLILLKQWHNDVRETGIFIHSLYILEINITNDWFLLRRFWMILIHAIFLYAWVHLLSSPFVDGEKEVVEILFLFIGGDKLISSFFYFSSNIERFCRISSFLFFLLFFLHLFEYEAQWIQSTVIFYFSELYAQPSYPQRRQR